MVNERFSQLLPEDPVCRKQRFLRLRSGDPELFRAAALQLAAGEAGEEGRQAIVSFLVQIGRLGNFLREDCSYKIDVGLPIMQLALQIQPTVDIVICRELAADTTGTDRAGSLFVLSLLEQTADLKRLNLPLSRLNHHPDSYVRSKAAQLFAASNATPAWLAAQLRSHDPRTRSNAIEGCIGSTTRDLWPIVANALGDPHPRVRATAAVALFPSARERSMETLLEMLGDERRPYRQAACWGMGELGDPEFEQSLKQFLLSKDPDRLLAIRPLRRIALAQPLLEVGGETSRPAPPDELRQEGEQQVAVQESEAAMP
jgi:hypothetical protein